MRYPFSNIVNKPFSLIKKIKNKMQLNKHPERHNGYFFCPNKVKENRVSKIMKLTHAYAQYLCFVHSIF
jgi:hypothetical protein